MAHTTNPKVGRPAENPEDRCDRRIVVLVTRAQFAAMKRKAGAERVAAWVRRVAVRAACPTRKASSTKRATR